MPVCISSRLRKQKLKEKSNFSRHFGNRKPRKWGKKAEDYGVCYLEISSAAKEESRVPSFQSQHLTILWNLVC